MPNTMSIKRRFDGESCRPRIGTKFRESADASSWDRRRPGDWPIDQTLEHRGKIIEETRIVRMSQGLAANHFAKKLKTRGQSNHHRSALTGTGTLQRDFQRPLEMASDAVPQDFRRSRIWRRAQQQKE